MGFRFRRRVRLFPGLWFNVSKSGVSTSIGGRGVTLNLGPRGTRTTVGVPGSGLSWRSPTRPWHRRPAPLPPANTNARRPTGIWIALAAATIGATAIALVNIFGG